MQPVQKIFISAVTDELGPYRARVALELRRRGIKVYVQEDFRLGGGTLVEKIQETINQCDAAICLVGRAYGAEPPEEAAPGQERHSYTQWEFLWCLERQREDGMPLFVYFCRPPKEPEAYVQSSEEARLQNEFIQFVRETGIHRETVESEDQLAVKVLQHDWDGPPRIAWRQMALWFSLLVVVAGVTLWKLAGANLKDLDRVHGTLRREVEEIVQDHLSLPAEPISTPDPVRQIVATLPSADTSGFDVLRKDHVWDARLAGPVDKNAIGQGGSALTLHSLQFVRKRSPLDVFVEAPKTSGTELFIRNQSQFPHALFALQEQRIVGDSRMTERQIHFDVSAVPVGGRFTIAMEATYWNSLQTSSDLWVGLTCPEGMRSASSLIILPENRPWKKFWATVAVNESTIRIEPSHYDEDDYFFIADDENRRWIYLKVLNPKKGYVYQLRWSW